MSKEIVNISKENYGKNLKANREESGLTQQQLAERLKIPRTEITMIENGKRFPKIERHKEIINALELDFETDFPYFEDDVSDLTNQLQHLKAENEKLEEQLEVAEKALGSKPNMAKKYAYMSIANNTYKALTLYFANDCQNDEILVRAFDFIEKKLKEINAIDAKQALSQMQKVGNQ